MNDEHLVHHTSASAQVDVDDKLSFAVRAPVIAISVLVPWLLIGGFWRLLH
jgi:hypothetical protein